MSTICSICVSLVVFMVLGCSGFGGKEPRAARQGLPSNCMWV